MLYYKQTVYLLTILWTSVFPSDFEWSGLCGGEEELSQSEPDSLLSGETSSPNNGSSSRSLQKEQVLIKKHIVVTKDVHFPFSCCPRINASFNKIRKQPNWSNSTGFFVFRYENYKFTWSVFLYVVKEGNRCFFLVYLGLQCTSEFCFMMESENVFITITDYLSASGPFYVILYNISIYCIWKYVQCVSMGKTNVTDINQYDDVISRIASVTVLPLGNLICMKTNESYQTITPRNKQLLHTLRNILAEFVAHLNKHSQHAFILFPKVFVQVIFQAGFKGSLLRTKT